MVNQVNGENDNSEEILTNRQGHPVTDNQNVRTVGNRGPMTLENYDFIEKISHFDREKFQRESFMRVVPVLMDILSHSER